MIAQDRITVRSWAVMNAETYVFGVNREERTMDHKGAFLAGRRFGCPDCSRTFTTPFTRDRHIVAEHAVDRDVCSIHGNEPCDFTRAECTAAADARYYADLDEKSY